MKNSSTNFIKIILRYLLLVLVSVPGLSLFYYVFLPLTIYPVYWALGLSYNVIMLNNTLFIQTKIIEIIGAWVAGSAYYFLLILNLITPKIETKKRIKLLLFTFGTFFIINLLRIYLLGIMYIEGSQFFDIAHKLFWYLGSTLFVVIIWFTGVWIFKIKEIPFASDLKYIYGKSSLKARIEKSKKKKSRNLKR